MTTRRSAKKTHPRGHRTKSAPSFAKQKWVSKKIRLLRHEGYDEKQAQAIAYRMAGIARPKKRTSRDASYAAYQHKEPKHRRAASHTYAEPEIKRTASYKRAERLEKSFAPNAWNTAGLSKKNSDRIADAWERAGFLGWADNYRAAAKRKHPHRVSGDRAAPRRAVRAKRSRSRSWKS